MIGAADDRAHVRADLRRDLHQAVRAAQEAEARSMMFDALVRATCFRSEAASIN